MNYTEFLKAKEHSQYMNGFDLDWMPDGMFDFQRYVTDYASKKGRAAVFLDTGLGKTLIELTIATNYIRQTNKPVLIITPLACLLYTSPSPRDRQRSRMPSSA